MKITKGQLTKVDWYSWIIQNGYLPSQKKYTFAGYEYLSDIVKMPWKEGDERYIKKSAQCGVSELAIQWMLWLCERGLLDFNGFGYMFPAMEQLQDHIKARVMPILEVPRFYSKLREANLRFIRYNNVPIYFRSGGGPKRGSTGANKALKGWPADAIVVDEFDEYTDPVTIIPSVQARLNNSKYKWIFGMSTPTHPDVGIDRVAKLCSEYNWFVECGCCHKKFSPLNEVVLSGFENCVDRDSKGVAWFICPLCGEFTNTCGAKGSWELDSEHPGQRTAFNISRLFLANASLTELLMKYEEAFNLQEFYNSDLGLPYSPPNSRLSRKDITECCLGDVENKRSSDRTTWAGVDVGKKCYYVIGRPTDNGNKEVIAYGSCKFDELDNILKLYNTKHLVIDLRPYEQEVKKILRGKRGYFACDFNTGHQEDWYRIIKIDTETINKTSRVIKADRTQSCDNLIEQIAAKKTFIFPGQVKNDNDFISQMCSPMRIDKSNKETGEVKSLYKSSSKKDHYFFAMGYLNLAFYVKKSSVAKIGGLFL